ncbi:MAG: bromoperoxidase [Actinomycetota bacterium]|nr:bromoperoxidase [Actinomycetota bacterium]
MLSHAEPELIHSDRAKAARAQRELAAEVSNLRPHAQTRANGEEDDFADKRPTNFTKGLAHDEFGLVAHPCDYVALVRAINSHDPGRFDGDVDNAEARGAAPKTEVRPAGGSSVPVKTWRGWESPRSGHAYDLEGPDAGALGMSPAPRIGASELAAEMAEVYAMALVRDVPFTEFDEEDPATLGPDALLRTPRELAELLGDMPFFDGRSRRSSTPNLANGAGLNAFERRRRAARTGEDLHGDLDGGLAARHLFRGSAEGARRGPYISQFLIAGNDGRPPTGTGVPSYPARASEYQAHDGYINYGAQIIDQRINVARAGLDYMTDWRSWLDVQNGWDYRGLDQFEEERRFITTPRDLATYVHFDALYQAYLNACLLLLGIGAPKSPGFPEPNPNELRDAFATFGDPHVLTLVTEVATRGLKAVRRQKFNYHRRARPEAIAGRLTLAAVGLAGQLGEAEDDVLRTLEEIPEPLRASIAEHNEAQNAASIAQDRWVVHTGAEPTGAVDFDGNNLLLPMAFPEGSPMHPAYGAGHATVAGGCVTMLKAFFDMFDRDGPNGLRVLELVKGEHGFVHLQPATDGRTLDRITVPDDEPDERLTIQGELDKLAANISVGRNMAGVHYYSDYYDSARMGERVAVGMLMEQLPLYGDPVSMSFNDFDGDLIEISGEPDSRPTLSVRNREGQRIDPADWWLRHAYGESSVHRF